MNINFWSLMGLAAVIGVLAALASSKLLQPQCVQCCQAPGVGTDVDTAVFVAVDTAGDTAFHPSVDVSSPGSLQLLMKGRTPDTLDLRDLVLIVRARPRRQ